MYHVSVSANWGGGCFLGYPCKKGSDIWGLFRAPFVVGNPNVQRCVPCPPACFRQANVIAHVYAFDSILAWALLVSGECIL